MNESSQQIVQSLLNPVDDEEDVVKFLEDEQISAIRKESLWKNPIFLKEAAYVLLSSDITTLQSAKNVLATFIHDLSQGDSDKWEEILERTRLDHQKKYNPWKSYRLAVQNESFMEEGVFDSETENQENLAVVHCTNFIPKLKDGEANIPTTYQATDGKLVRTTWHAAMNHVVGEVSTINGAASWENKRVVVISPYSDFSESNGTPFGFLPQDIFWEMGIDKSVRLPKSTTVLIDNSFTEEEIAYLRSSGIRVIITDNPVQQTNETLEEMGFSEIRPEEFKNPKRFAAENNAFWGLHDGLSSTDDSGSIDRAESMLSSITMREQLIRGLVNEYNNTNIIEDRYQSVINLIANGYFTSKGEDGLKIYALEEMIEYQFDFISQLRQRDVSDPYSSIPDIIKIIDAFIENHSTLAELSNGMFNRKIQTLKDNLETIPPDIIGAFVSSYQEQLK